MIVNEFRDPVGLNLVGRHVLNSDTYAEEYTLVSIGYSDLVPVYINFCYHADRYLSSTELEIGQEISIGSVTSVNGDVTDTGKKLVYAGKRSVGCHCFYYHKKDFRDLQDFVDAFTVKTDLFGRLKRPTHVLHHKKRYEQPAFGYALVSYSDTYKIFLCSDDDIYSRKISRSSTYLPSVYEACDNCMPFPNSNNRIDTSPDVIKKKVTLKNKHTVSVEEKNGSEMPSTKTLREHLISQEILSAVRLKCMESRRSVDLNLCMSLAEAREAIMLRIRQSLKNQLTESAFNEREFDDNSYVLTSVDMYMLVAEDLKRLGVDVHVDRYQTEAVFYVGRRPKVIGECGPFMLESEDGERYAIFVSDNKPYVPFSQITILGWYDY